MFSAMKLFVAKETMAKFAVSSYGSYVTNELNNKRVPKEYGGDEPPLTEAGESLKLD
jgi:phosphatidylinositol transfer protein SFH5